MTAPPLGLDVPDGSEARNRDGVFEWYREGNGPGADRSGYEVVATARRHEAIADLAVARTPTLDVDSDESVAAAQAAAGPVDILVNNAGFGIEGPVEEVPLAEVRRAFETNFLARRMIQAFVPAMRERGSGTIVNVTSVAGIVGGPLAGFYSATKFALEALSESLHLEVGHFGVKVLVVEPGLIATRFGDNMVDLRANPDPTPSWPRYGERHGCPWRRGARTRSRARGDEDLRCVRSRASPLRLPVGADAELIASSRQGASFDDFEGAMRQILKLDW